MCRGVKVGLWLNVEDEGFYLSWVSADYLEQYGFEIVKGGKSSGIVKQV